MNRLTTIALCSLMLAACGKNNETNNASNNTTPNNNTANNTTPNNNTANNTTPNNNTANNTTPNNNTANNTTANNTTGTTNYTPVEWMCDDVTPSGTLAVGVGISTITGACIGTDPYEGVYQLCAGAVITSFEYTDFGGFQLLNADNTYVLNGWLDANVGLFWPQTCVDAVGGDCASTGTFLEGLLETLGGEGTVACSDGATGGCECDLTGRATVRSIGTIDSAADGMATLNFFDDEGAPLAEDWRFSTDGIQHEWQHIAEGTRWSSEAGGAATACEVYCTGFLANCNDDAGVTAYDDADDCMTQCAGFTVAGSEQTTGDSLECRTYHLYVSADTSDAANQATHCPHAQATATGPCMN